MGNLAEEERFDDLRTSNMAEIFFLFCSSFLFVSFNFFFEFFFSFLIFSYIFIILSRDRPLVPEKNHCDRKVSGPLGCLRSSIGAVGC